jgi:hypothetical protein
VPPAHWEVSRARVRLFAFPAVGIAALALLSATGPDWVALLAWLVFAFGSVGYALWLAPRRWLWAIALGNVLVVGLAALNFWWQHIRVDPGDDRHVGAMLLEAVVQSRPQGTTDQRVTWDIQGLAFGFYGQTRVFATSRLTGDPRQVLHRYALTASQSGWLLAPPRCYASGYSIEGFKQFHGWTARLSIHIQDGDDEVRASLSTDAAADPHRKRHLTDGQRRLNRDVAFLDTSCLVGMGGR